MQLLEQTGLIRYIKILKILEKGIENIEKARIEREMAEESWRFLAEVFTYLEEKEAFTSDTCSLFSVWSQEIKEISLKVESTISKRGGTNKHLECLRKLISEFEEAQAIFVKPENRGNNKDYFASPLCLTLLQKTDKTRELIVKEIQKRERELETYAIVYLIGNKSAGIIKIGHTKKLETRLKQLQSNCSHKLEVIATKRGTRETEQRELEKAKKFRIQGEWFTWDDSIIENF